MMYKEQMKQDIRNYIKENPEVMESKDFYTITERLNDDLWTEDSVTGNASGSYTFSSWQAKEYVMDDGIEYYREAVKDFDIPADKVAEDFLEENWESIDVTIRCYLLGQVIDEVVEELLKE